MPHPPSKILKIAKDVIECEALGLAQLKDAILTNLSQSFCDAVNAIYSTKGPVFVSGIGKSGHIAQKISATFSSTGTPSFFIHPSEAAHGDLGMINKHDILILISNSGDSEEITPLIDYCNIMSIPIIGISHNIDSVLMRSASIKLLIPKSKEASMAPTTSSTVALALGDALAVSLHTLRGFTNDDFKLLHPGGKIGKSLLKVCDLMHKGSALPLINQDAPLMSVVTEMTSKRFGCTGITDNAQNLIGIITDGDLRRNINKDISSLAVRDIMSHSPVAIYDDDLASKAASLMNKKSITVIFCMNRKDGNKKPSGILHMHDLLNAGLA